VGQGHRRTLTDRVALPLCDDSYYITTSRPAALDAERLSDQDQRDTVILQQA
jgi:hypothetical protein